MDTENHITKNTKESPLGSSFDDFLHEENIYEESTLAAKKKVLAIQSRQKCKDVISLK
jgi:hypothetical protein